MICLIPFLSKFVSEQHLSSPQPEFQHEVQKFAGGDLHSETFTDCSLLHRLLIFGREDVVFQRKEELSPSLLSHTCTSEGDWSYTKVSFDRLFSSPTR